MEHRHQLLLQTPLVFAETDEDIKSMGAKGLDEVLETVPGIHVSRSAVNYASMHQIRGISNNSPPRC